MSINDLNRNKKVQLIDTKTPKNIYAGFNYYNKVKFYKKFP